MYYCGYRDLAHVLHASEWGSNAASATLSGFALPGDRPAYAPDRPADVQHLDINVTPDFVAQSVSGTVTTYFSVLFEQIQVVSFDAAELQIEQASLAGTETPLAFWTEGEKLYVQLDRVYRYGEGFGVTVRYSAHPRIGLYFVAPTKDSPELPVQVWTQGETEYHHYWLVCHDFPNDRATTTLRATVPAHFFVLSNGLLMDTRTNGDGTKTYTWQQEIPYPAYLITLVAGEFSELSDTWRDVPVTYYVRHGREEDARRMLGKTPQMMEFFSQKFGVDYPYAKYAQIVAERFLGAMENASATTHSYRLLPDQRASLDWSADPVVAHELVHQWHGDLLAVRDWSHTWLKESFATYFEAVWTQHDRGDEEFEAKLYQNLQSYLSADKRGRRPIVYNVYRKNGDELFDRHTYEKGSLVLHMLRNFLGEEPFWRAVSVYNNRNRGREVITADFERAVEEATGRSMAQFFEQWLYKAGHPDFQVSYSWDSERKLARVQVVQTQNVTECTPLFRTPVDIGFLIPERDDALPDDVDVPAQLVTFRVVVEEAQQAFFFPLARRPFSVRFDQGGWLIKTLTFERSAELLRFQLRHDPDILGRIEAAEALGKLADEQSLKTLEQRLVVEPFWAVRVAIAEALASQKSERALTALTAALAQFTDPKSRCGIVTALGIFGRPKQNAYTEQAAQVLIALLERGDPSYFVEAAAATALGKLRTSDVLRCLLERIDTPSWNETLRAGIFTGLGELGDVRGADGLVSWLTDGDKPVDARAAAAAGLRVLASTRHIDPGAVQTKVIEALLAALDDPWELVVINAISALRQWEDVRAIDPLRRLVSRCLDERIVRIARETILELERGLTLESGARQLRHDVDELQDENRQLRERLDSIERQLCSHEESETTR
ncbi:MAG: M1 family aminopeptidase [Ktedonobacterales bacterium]